ncbi:hypothetical protein Droror1_Dr00020729 [Drosera rotundifolia]
MALFAVAGLLVALSWAAATTQLSEHTSCSSVSLADSCESYLNSSTTTDSPPSSCCVSVRSSRLCFCSLDDNSQEDFLKLAPDCGITSFSANCSSSSSNSSSSSSSTSISPASPSASPTAPSPSTEPTPADATPTTPADSGSHTPSITTQAKSFPIRVIAAVVAVVCVVAIAVAIFCLWKRRTRMKNTASDPESGDDANSLLKKKRAMPTHATLDPESVKGGSREIELPSTESLQYDLIILKEATEDFSESNEIGRGAFGIVYKGVLRNGEEIAVKRLTTYSQHNTEEFKNEVSLVASLQHKNLVRLTGFCFNGEEKLLVFEFLPNKSLDHFLFDLEKRKQLDWRRRYKIIKGIAGGLLYLHEDSRHRIVHRDLKAANILLDANMIPKISDFGTARLVHIDKSWMEASQIAGTFGYMAPEYALDWKYSVKSDVYSFGVLILEIISGRRKVRSSDQSGMPQDLLNDAWNCWSDGEALKFMDETLASSYYSSTEVMKCIQLGLLCVQRNPDERPSTASAVNTLNNITTIILPEPQEPLCFNTLVPESSSNSLAKWTTTYSSEVTNP